MRSLSRNSTLAAIRSFISDIKLSHSIFALPFAASALVLGRDEIPNYVNLILLALSMVFARTFAMGFNRWLDRKFDAQNPRTMNRSIPSRRLSPGQAFTFTLLAGFLFIAVCACLNDVALSCSVPLLIILAAYSTMKRISWLSHFYLGACLGLAPIAVSLALDTKVDVEIFILALAVMIWTAGFDCLYSLQDADFDRKNGLHSIPTRFGPRITFVVSLICFYGMVLLLSVIGTLGDHGYIYRLGVVAVGLLLSYELWLVRDIWYTGRSSNMHSAFFTSNASVSIVFFTFCIMDRLL